VWSWVSVVSNIILFLLFRVILLSLQDHIHLKYNCSCCYYNNDSGDATAEEEEVQKQRRRAAYEEKRRQQWALEEQKRRYKYRQSDTEILHEGYEVVDH